MQGDVRELKDCEKAIAAVTDKWGRLDILVNAAAGNFLAPAEVLSPKGFKTGIAALTRNQDHDMASVLPSSQGMQHVSCYMQGIVCMTLHTSSMA